MYVRRANPTAVRVLLVLAALATLCGCRWDAQALHEAGDGRPVGRIEDVDGGEIRAIGPAAVPGAPDAGFASGAFGKEREARVEALCRMLAYTAREGMDGRESVEFANKALVLSDEELGQDGSRPPSVGAARNRALDRLGVPRYEGCEVGG